MYSIILKKALRYLFNFELFDKFQQEHYFNVQSNVNKVK